MEGQGYCVKCKAKRKMMNAKYKTSKRGGRMLQGSCENCNTTMTMFVKKEEGK